MTTTINITRNHNLHNTYGGCIYDSDFNTEHSYGNIVSRIISDQRFDIQCKKNIEFRKKSKEGRKNAKL